MMLIAAVMLAGTGTNPPDCQKFALNVVEYAQQAIKRTPPTAAELALVKSKTCTVHVTANSYGYTERVEPEGCTPTEVVSITKGLTGIQYNQSDWNACAKKDGLKFTLYR